jgi:hypothetical protein
VIVEPAKLGFTKRRDINRSFILIAYNKKGSPYFCEGSRAHLD